MDPKMGNKKLIIFFNLIVLLLLFQTFVHADDLPTLVRPLSYGVIQPGTEFQYSFNFTSDSDCTNVLSSDTQNILTDGYGIGYASINLSSLIIPPNYKCEYRNGVLRKVHEISDSLSDDLYVAGNIYLGENTTVKNDLDLGNNSILNITKMVFTGNCEDEIPKTLCVDPDDHTLRYVTGLGNIIQLGQEIFGIGINKEGRSLPDGTVVSLSGAQGDRFLFIAADGSNITKSSFMGVLTTTCGVNEECPVTVFGDVRNIDTSAWASGTKLYLNCDEPGNLSSTVPTLPCNPLWIAAVKISHNKVGSIGLVLRDDPSDGFLSNTAWFTDWVNIKGDLSVEGEIRGGFIDRYDSGVFNGSLYTNGANSTDSDSNSLFQVISDTRGTPQFQIQNGGDGQASFIARSFIVINQNNTLLNSSENGICSSWGFNYIKCNTAATGADLGVTDDIEALNIIHAGKGFQGQAGEQGTYLQLGDVNVKYSGSNGIYNKTTKYFCDFTSNNFDNTTGWIKLIAETSIYEGASADINSYINNSCVSLKNNPAWLTDIITPVTWQVIEDPEVIITKGGFTEFYVGNNEESKFKIKTKNGTGKEAFYVDTTSGKNSLQSINNVLDINGFTSGIAHNTLVSSSVMVDNAHTDIYTIIGDTSRMNNSEMHFLDLTRIGNEASDSVDAIHVHGKFDTIIKSGGEEIITSSFYGSINITSNVTGIGSDVEVFINDNDILYVGNSLNFTILGVSLSTTSDIPISPNYYYCNSSSEWEQFAIEPSDTSNQWKQSGKIVWENPTNRGTCNKELDGTPFTNTNNYTYIAIERTRNNLNIPPVINELQISGAITNFILKEDLIKLNPVNIPPETCNVNWAGAMYYDNNINKMCNCDGTNWVQMNDYSTVCS